VGEPTWRIGLAPATSNVVCRLDAEWPAWVNGPSALSEAYNLGLKGSGYRAVVKLEQSLRKPANIAILMGKRDGKMSRVN
jgi:hypothetical protein